MKRIRGKLTYANVMATTAMFIALGGVSYATTQLPKNSVGTKQLKNGAVTPSKISSSTREILAGQRGPAGPQGSTGAMGAAGGIGSAATTLASGQSESAPWSSAGANSGPFVALRFQPPLANGLPAADLHYMGESTSALCPGAGQAAVGQLCIYAAPGNPFTFNFFEDPVTGSEDQNAAPYGVNMQMFAGAHETTTGGGSWTLTAP